MKTFEIPAEPIEALSKEPKTLIIYSAPKIGKTTIIAGLKNHLIMEHEPNGAGAVKARYVQLSNPYEIGEFIEYIKSDPAVLKGVDFIIVDTITKWDEWSEVVGTHNFMAKPQGKKWNLVDKEQVWDHNHPMFETVHAMGEGYGYRYSREVMLKWYDKIVSTGKTVVLLAHMKDKFIESSSGDVVETVEINLTGKVKSAYSARVDAIAHMKRVGNKAYLSFESGGNVAAGSRYAYLKGQILISESDEEGNVTTYWDKVFPYSYGVKK
jgi:hypothetical protein